MHVYGLTGGIASGKSTVSEMLRARGEEVVCADSLYHALIAPTAGRASTLAEAVNVAFPGVLEEDGSLARKRLGPQIFGDPNARGRLDAITHPAIAAAFGAVVESRRSAGVKRLFYDMPLLFELGLQDAMAGTVLVWVSREVQQARLMARAGLDAVSADARLKSQGDLNEKRRLATWVIDNQGALSETDAQLGAVLDAIDTAEASA